MSRLFALAHDELPVSSCALVTPPGCPSASLTRKVSRIAVVAATSLWLTAVALPAARAEVVFGNLGPSGTGALDPRTFVTTSTNPTGSANRALAMGFKTPAGLGTWLVRNLGSVTLGLGNVFASPATFPRTVSIFTDDGGKPSSTVFAKSGTISTTGTSATRYTFTFATEAGLLMQPNTTYWVVPEQGTTNPSAYRWFQDAAPAEPPVPFDGSGYSYVGARTRNLVSGTQTWVSAPQTSYSLSLAIIPVPETSTLPLAGIGLVVGGWAVRLRRSRQRSVIDSDDVSDLEAGEDQA